MCKFYCIMCATVIWYAAIYMSLFQTTLKHCSHLYVLSFPWQFSPLSPSSSFASLPLLLFPWLWFMIHRFRHYDSITLRPSTRVPLIWHSKSSSSEWLTFSVTSINVLLFQYYQTTCQDFYHVESVCKSVAAKILFNPSNRAIAPSTGSLDIITVGTGSVFAKLSVM
jgi:hypothetical protein